MKKAFVTGIAGQDGAYLSAFLLSKGYEVHGLIRWDSYAETDEALHRINALKLNHNTLEVHTGDVTDAGNLTGLLGRIRPDEIYNLAGMSQVKVSFDTPSATLDINAKGALNIFEAVRHLGLDTKIYQASSSEMFGRAPAPQNEETPMNPCSPYGVAKVAAYHSARNYREAYGMFIANGILFNHESPLRGEDFVTRKITKAVAEIEAGRTEPLTLGNLDALRDWGDARDYIEGMWMMLQHDVPDDFVLATGDAISVRDFVERAFAHIGKTIKWQGDGLQEVGLDAKTDRPLVTIDEALFRPSEIHHLLGDATKARNVLGWNPTRSLDDMIADMIDQDRPDKQDVPLKIAS